MAIEHHVDGVMLRDAEYFLRNSTIGAHGSPMIPVKQPELTTLAKAMNDADQATTEWLQEMRSIVSG